MKNSIKIAIADDHLFVRQGLVALLKEFETIEVLFDVNNGKEALEMLKKHHPDIVLLDIEMPVMDGAETFDKIKTRYPGIKVIILSSHYTDSYIIEFVKKGVAGFLNKNTSIEKIIEVITAIYKDDFYYDCAVALIMSRVITFATETTHQKIRADLNLTDQELTIVKLICKNKTSAEIANQLFISIRTVEGHRLHIRQKTNCKNTMDLVAFSIKNNIVSYS